MINNFMLRYKKNKLRFDISFNYLSSFFELSAGLVTMTLINRQLGVNSYGVIMTILALFGVTKAFISTGNQTAVTRFISTSLLEHNKEKCSNYFTIGILIDIITCILFVLFLNVVPFFSESLVEKFHLNNEIFQILLYGTCLNILSASLLGIINAREMFKSISIIKILATLSKLFFIMFFIKRGIYYVAIGYLISDLIIFLSSIFVSHCILKKFIVFRIKINYIKEYINFIKYNFASSTIKSMIIKLDIIILSYFSNSFLVGQFETIKKLFLPLNFISPAISNVLFPKFSKYSLQKKIQKAKAIILKASKIIIGLSIIYIILIFLFLKSFSELQNIEIKLSVFLILSIYYLLQTSIWWGNIYFQNFDFKFPLFTNMIFLFSTLIFTSISFYIVDNKILAISVGLLLSFLPSYFLGLRHLIKNKL